MFRIGCVFLFALLVEGCAVSLDIPANRFDSPETMGRRWRAGAEIEVGGSNSMVLTPDLYQSSPNPNLTGYDDKTFFRAGGGVEVAKNFDVLVRTVTGLEFEAKYQLLGQPRLTATAGNFSLAVTGSLVFGYDATGTYFTPNSGGLENDQFEYGLDAALIAGIRASDWCLFYGGPFIRKMDFDGTERSTDSNGNPLNTILTYSGSGVSTGANLGVELGSPIVEVRLELAYANIKGGTTNTGRVFGGVALAAQFGKRDPETGDGK